MPTFTISNKISESGQHTCSYTVYLQFWWQIIQAIKILNNVIITDSCTSMQWPGKLKGEWCTVTMQIIKLYILFEVNMYASACVLLLKHQFLPLLQSTVHLNTKLNLHPVELSNYLMNKNLWICLLEDYLIAQKISMK